MKKRVLAALLFLLILAVLLPVVRADARSALSDSTHSTESEHFAQTLNCKGYGACPLFFIPNEGQTDEQVSFTVSGKDKTIFFTDEGLTIDLRGQSNGATQGCWTLKLNFIGANRVIPESLETSETVVSYFAGEPDSWHTNLRTSSKIIYRNLWNGIDLIFSGTCDRLKYEFVVRSGADPAQIKLAYSGADSAAVNKDGDLLVSTPVCELIDGRPLAFQDGGQSSVEVAYNLDKNGMYSYGFALGPYDTGKTLIIDPAVLVYSGLIGGTSGDKAAGIAVDTSGAAYVVGGLNNQTNFPVTVGPSLSTAGSGDVFVAKLNVDGTGLEYCGFIGGSDLDTANCVAVDAAGCAIIGGNTYSDNFPVANTGWTDSGTLKGLSDSFVAKVSADGTQLLYCGYLGGTSNEAINGISLDEQANVYVTGSTASDDFPSIAGWNNATSLRGLSDAFVAKIAFDGSALLWSGFLGGNDRDYGMGLATDVTGVYIIGQTRSTEYPVVNAEWTGATALKGTRDAFVTKLAADGSTISYSGYIGGSLDDDVYAVAVDTSGCAYLAGETNSADLPVSAGWNGATAPGGSKDAFVAKVNAAGTALDYCGYLSGADWDTGCCIAAEASGAAYVAGNTHSTNFPVMDAFWQDSTTLRGNCDAFVTKINPAGTALEYSGFLGGNDFDYATCIAIDGSGTAYVGGYATSNDFPHVSAAWPGAGINQGERDAFAAKITQVSAPAVCTGEILDLTATDALIWGEVTDDGGNAVTERGVVYSASPDPTIATGTSVIASDAGTGDFNVFLTGLSANTAYYVRAYATNATETSYGETRHFTTPLSVTTVTITDESMLAPIAVNKATNKIYTGSIWSGKLYMIDGETDTLSTSLTAGSRDFTLAVNEQTNKIYSANGTSVFITDGTTNAVTILTLNSGAKWLAINETTNKIYVASENATTPLYVIDGATDTIERTVVTGAKGSAVAVNETANEIYVADDMGGTVTVIDGTDYTVKATVTVGTRPRNIAVNEQTHMLYVVNWGNYLNDGTVTVIDGDDSFSALTINIGSAAYPYDAAVNETTNTVYVSLSAFDSVLVIDGADNSTKTVPVGVNPGNIAVNEQTNKIYIGNSGSDDRSTAGYIVTELDGATLETVGFADINAPEQLAINISTNKLYVSHFTTEADAPVLVIALAAPVPMHDYVCEIVGGKQYETLDAAVAAVSADTPTTIRLLENINRTSTLTVDVSKKIMLDLNGHILNINTASGAALNVSQDGSFITMGDGTLNANGFSTGIYASGDATVNVTGNISAADRNATGIYADGNLVNVTVNGNVSGYSGACVSSSAKVTVNGSITGERWGITVTNGGNVSVSGNVSACAVLNGSCITVFSGTVNIGGNVMATGTDSDGIYAANGSVLFVGGSISGVRHAITAYATDVDITGSVSTSSSTSSYTVYVGNSAEMNIGGDVVGAGDCGIIVGTNGKVTIAGAIQSYYTGILASTGGEVFALGNVIADNTVGCGVNANQTGEVTIDGTIQAHKPMVFGETNGNLASQTTKNGYLTYTDGGDNPSYIWVKGSLPTVTTYTVETSDVTQTSAAVSGNVISAGSASVTECGFVYGTSANPTTVNDKVMVSRGTGDLFATLTGLTAGTVYHVRAYAISAVGTAYGEDRIFTTQLGSSGNTAGGSSSSATQTYNAVVSQNQKQVATLPVTVVAGSNIGKVELTGTKAAEYFAAETGTVILVPSIPNVTSYDLELPASVLSVAQTENPLTFETPYGGLVIPGNMLSKLPVSENKKAGVTIGQGDRKSLTEVEKSAIGTRPIIQLTLTLDRVQTDWNNPDAPVRMTIPYNPTAAELENFDSIIIWYLDGGGKPICVPNGHYNVSSGTVNFTTTHFSNYAVGYNPVNFKDVASGVWYHDAVSFIAARDITTGTGNGNFSPDAALTRGQIIVLLMRTYGIASDGTPADNFSDAGSTWYTGYLAAAKRLGITKGIGDNKFAPDQAVTRQEMFTLLYNILKVLNQLPSGTSNKMLSDFSDARSVASWAKEAITLLMENGMISGSGGKLSPTDTTTRAEMAQVLYNLLTQ